MKKFAHTHSVTIQNKQFCAHTARKECGYSNEVGKKIHFLPSKTRYITI